MFLYEPAKEPRSLTSQASGGEDEEQVEAVEILVELIRFSEKRL